MSPPETELRDSQEASEYTEVREERGGHVDHTETSKLAARANRVTFEEFR